MISDQKGFRSKKNLVAPSMIVVDDELDDKSCRKGDSVLKLFFLCSILFMGSSVFAADDLVKKICDQVSSLGPTAAEKKNTGIKLSGENCNSEAYYYGMGRPVDYVKARLCAFEETPVAAFASNAILMMVYANGYGVNTNIPLAENYACAIDTPGSDQYKAARLQHLEKLKADSSLKIDICDDDGSNFMSAECTGHKNRMAGNKQDQGFKLMMQGWTAGEKAAFTKLQAAQKKYSEARAHKEIDQRGTGRDTFIQEEEGEQAKDFGDSLKNFERDQVLAVSTEDYKKIDELLNANYKKIQQSKNPDPDNSTVNKDGVQETQKAWLKYRDAWMAFAKIKYPKISSDSVAALFTKKRNAMLENLLRDPFGE